MALATSCPHCRARYNLADELAGKKILCKQCERPFVVADDEPPRSALLQRPGHAVQDRSRPGSPRRPADDRDDRPRHRSRADEDDRDDRPRRRSREDEDDRRPPRPKSKKGLILTLCIGGPLLVIGGVIAMIVLLTPSELDRRLTDLKGDNDESRDQAIVWFLDANTNIPQRAKVAQALETMLGSNSPTLNRNNVLTAYLRWADTDNVPYLLQIVAAPVHNPILPSWDFNKTAQVMEALGRMQDERAIEPLADKLSDFLLGNAATSALKSMGPKAEKTVLKQYFSNNLVARDRARQLLEGYGTKPEVIAGEALRHLQSTDLGTRRGALAWFMANGPANDASRAEVAKVLLKRLDDLHEDIRTEALKALRLWYNRECLPRLVDFAKSQEKATFGNAPLIDLLAQFKEEAAAEAIGLQFPNNFQRGKAYEALKNMGAPAEKVVLKFINHPDWGTHLDARRLCKEKEMNISSDKQLTQTLADIASTDAARRRVALQQLATLKPGKKERDKVARALDPLLLDDDNAVRVDALNAVKVWATRKNTATLLKILDSKEGPNKAFGHRPEIIEILGQLKDPEAAPVLARSLLNFFERGQASKALKEIGAEAEEAVIPYLGAMDGGIRGEACDILGEIGTKAKSGRGLQLAARKFPQDFGFINGHVKPALQKIILRGD